MEKSVFKRKIYSKILEWKERSGGRTALMIEGPRRVGKSTITRLFAEKEYESHIIIDFNKVSSDIKKLFNDLTDIDYIFLVLQTAFNVVLQPRKSVLVFDEVQKCPQARQAIKYLVEDGRYDYIETGSLISIKQNTKDITIPSEEERIEMHPMDFEEFLWALGDNTTVDMIKTFWDTKRALGVVHRKVMRDFRLYILIGGMPQAIEEYIATNNFSLVDKVKRNIIKLYEDDFLKIDPSGRISRLFMAIPAQLNKNSTRYSSSGVIGKQNDTTLLEMIKSLEDSKTVNISYHCDDPNIGMALTSDRKKYKMYLADTGLFITLAFWDKDVTDNIIYQKLLSDKLAANLGYVYENVVAQCLVANGHNLFYYTWKYDDRHFYEIDFLISNRTKIEPIEVKSSSISSHTSLDAFLNKFPSRINRAFLVAPKDLGKDGRVILLPPYFVQFI